MKFVGHACSPQAGQVVARQLYDPYGTTRYTEGALPTDFEFTGQRKDSYTQLVQMGARWYDPYLGRWASADTIVPDPANPQSLNRYSYVRNNPLKYRDPSGHAECIDAECNMLANPTNGNVIIADIGGSALYELILLASLAGCRRENSSCKNASLLPVTGSITCQRV